jgi:hypothetical protein
MIKKISSKHEAAQELHKLYQLFGIDGDVPILLKDDLAYFCIEPLFPVLCLDKEQIHVLPGRYFKYKKQMFVNKYAVHSLIGQSTAVAAEQIMDYFFEILNLIESKGSVEIEDVMSRKEIEAEIKLNNQVNDYNVRTIKKYKKLLRESKKEAATAQAELAELLNKMASIEQMNEELLTSNQEMTEIITKLSRFVRIKGSDKGKKLVQKLQLEDEYDTDELADNEPFVMLEAKDAKKKLATVRTGAKKKITNAKKILHGPAGDFMLTESLIEKVYGIAKYDVVKFDEAHLEQSELLEQGVIPQEEFPYGSVCVYRFECDLKLVGKLRVIFSQGLISKPTALAIINEMT